MIEVLLQLFVPESGTVHWQWLWNAYNFTWFLIATVVLYVMFLRMKDRTMPLWGNPLRSKHHLGALILAIVMEFLLIVGSLFLQNPDETFPFYAPLFGLASFLDEFLYIEDLFRYPVYNLPWYNITVRVAAVIGMYYTGVGVATIATDLTGKLEEFFRNKFTTTYAKKIADKIWEFLKKFSLVGVLGIGTVSAVGSEQHREKIKEILDWLGEILQTVTVLSKLPEDAATIIEMAQAFFVVILSILMVAVYLMLIVAAASIAYVLWENRSELIQGIKNWFGNIGYILLIIAVSLAVIFFSVLVAANSTDMQDVIRVFAERSPEIIFRLIQQVVISIIGLAVFAIMICTLIVIVQFGSSFVIAWCKAIRLSNVQKASYWYAVRCFGLIFLVLALCSVLVFAYDPIRGWLVERFAETEGGYNLWWVTWHLCSGMLAFICIAASIFLMIYAFAWMGNRFRHCVANLRKSTAAWIGEQNSRRKPFSVRWKELVRRLGETLIQIFEGYRTEAQKNSAIFVAACFASLASLINTVMGLNDFNIWLIIAIAMSFAVQLAMLIFGMKAGQGMAEKIVTDVKQVGGSLGVAILRKLAVSTLYLLMFLAVQAGVILGFRLENPDWSFAKLLNPDSGFFPVLLIWLALLFFSYGIGKQIVEIAKLAWKWWKNRKNGRQESSAGNLVLSTPRSMPYGYYLAAYLVLMIVSTGFAFTNLFGGYANQVQLHTRVYDQVYSKTEETLDLQGKALKIVTEFNDKSEEVFIELTRQIEDVLAKDADNRSYLEDWKSKYSEKEPLHNDATYWAFLNVERDYTAGTADLAAFCEMLESTLTRDYDSFGENMTIMAYEYTHYLAKDNEGKEIIPNRVTPLYKTVAFRINLGDVGGKTFDIGRVNGNPVQDDGRYPSVDGDGYEVSIKTREVSNANKYTLMNELLAAFRSSKQDVEAFYAANGVQKWMEEQGGGTDLQGEGGQGGVTTVDSEEMLDEEEEDNLTELLNHMEILDDVRRNVAELYFMAYPDAEHHVPMIDLPRVIDLCLIHDEMIQKQQESASNVLAEITVPTQPTGSLPAETTEPTQPTGSLPTETAAPDQSTANLTVETTVPEETTDETRQESKQSKKDSDSKETAYQELSNYVDRSLQIFNILNIADSVLDKTHISAAITAPSQPAETAESETSESKPNEPETTDPDEENVDEDQVKKTDKAYWVRSFRSYAKGVSSSNFQIAFDTLFKGGFGMNNTEVDELPNYAVGNPGETGIVINALYSSQLVAVFILVICALVDCMAFFAGLLLFQDVFVFEMEQGSKLEKLGYVNFEAVLTDYFLPVDSTGKTRSHQIALIYYLLNRRPFMTLDMQVIDQINVDVQGFAVRVYQTLAFLDKFGIKQDSAELHVWLDKFVKRNNIDFDEILK